MYQLIDDKAGIEALISPPASRRSTGKRRSGGTSLHFPIPYSLARSAIFWALAKVRIG